LYSATESEDTEALKNIQQWLFLPYTLMNVHCPSSSPNLV